LQDVRNALQQAEQSYQEAQDALAELLEGADRLDVEELQKEIDAAELEIEAAGLSLEEAQSKLEHAELVAPFGGIVVAVEIDEGDTVSAGEVAVVLATLDHLQAVTVDLTELDVAQVEEGQGVVVTVDAMPEEEMRGVVERIGLQAQDYRGDVVYPVYVELDEVMPQIRWGMTAMVEIDVD
jgi:HlyD family secretion protein